MHDGFQPAGMNLLNQRIAQRAVADEVGGRRPVQDGERIDEHVWRLVAAEPAGEGQPRRREAGQRHGTQAFHR